jgi:hypothetical protein
MKQRNGDVLKSTLSSAVINDNISSLYVDINSILLTKYCSGDKIENNEMGGECSMYGVEERRIQGFGGEN